MSVVAEFSLAHDEFALADAFGAHADLLVEMERMVAGPSDRLLNYVWAIGQPRDVESVLAADPTTVRVTELTRAECGTLFEIEWIDPVTERVRGLLEQDVVLLTLVGRSAGWNLRVRVREHDVLSRVRSYLADLECQMELQRLHSPEMPTVDGQYMLTDTQRETLQLAHELGYYDIPREVTMSDLAAELDVSQQALSKRLRRAHETMTQHVLAGGPELDGPMRG